eukprot:CAMPEP_0116869974 /NCGR_PEP_ID=MMETSP0418-20121206/28046_1 /TAXON_ID=1158023 /ORGANISM="Astrosyne radiata, Strain 13vi08-1A" /LENGTH=157 /DNA_ID=CAMNT_0004506107 /DNA_START=60 /DNA_END=530 /DNA_ORIENTATION=+
MTFQRRMSSSNVRHLPNQKRIAESPKPKKNRGTRRSSVSGPLNYAEEQPPLSPKQSKKTSSNRRSSLSSALPVLLDGESPFTTAASPKRTKARRLSAPLSQTMDFSSENTALEPPLSPKKKKKNKERRLSSGGGALSDDGGGGSAVSPKADRRYLRT